MTNSQCKLFTGRSFVRKISNKKINILSNPENHISPIELQTDWQTKWIRKKLFTTNNSFNWFCVILDYTRTNLLWAKCVEPTRKPNLCFRLKNALKRFQIKVTKGHLWERNGGRGRFNHFFFNFSFTKIKRRKKFWWEFLNIGDFLGRVELLSLFE